MATFIYVMSTPGKVKVGKARDPKRRLASLQTGNPEEIRLIRLYQCPNEEAASQLERVCHEQISKYHYRGEWFKEACLPEVDKFLAAQKYKQAPIMVRQDIKRKEIKGLSGSELKYLYNWSYKDFSDRIRSRPPAGVAPLLTNCTLGDSNSNPRQPVELTERESRSLEIWWEKTESEQKRQRPPLAIVKLAQINSRLH